MVITPNQSTRIIKMRRCAESVIEMTTTAMKENAPRTTKIATKEDFHPMTLLRSPCWKTE